jgi:hypothetical protein
MLIQHYTLFKRDILRVRSEIHINFIQNLTKSFVPYFFFTMVVILFGQFYYS